MKKLTVFSYVLIILLSLTILSISTISMFSIKTLSDFIYQEVEASLWEEAQLIYNIIPEYKNETAENYQEITEGFLSNLKIRITLISPNGSVLADSHEDYRKMENHSDRTEIFAALNNQKESSIRLSSTLGEQMLYIALPSGSKNVIVRAALSIDHIMNKVLSTFRNIIIFSIFILLIVVVISIYTAKLFTSIINSVKNISEFYAQGDFSKKLIENGPREVILLKKSINSMGEQLQEIVSKVSVQKNELQAMLNSMVDSVILLNNQMEIMEMNPAAEELLSLSFSECKKRNIKNIIPNTNILTLVEKSFSDKKYCEETVTFSLEPIQYIQIHCTPIEDIQSSSKGVLLVMNNMTRMKQLENMRKDFVANVSHELKTPVTLINGYTETLLDGAKNDPEKLNQFLKVIDRHSIRINHIIDDLLILSNIEDKGTNISLEEVALYDIIFSAYTSALNNAEKEGISMKIECNEQIKLLANPILLEQAILNLINNAIKYSGKGSIVSIVGTIEENHSKKDIIISVKDNGKGMDEKLLERIFERFYRINREQSKKMGGTGLGLSIVKHIALSHNGHVTVKSKPGQGSVFTITLPIL